MQTQCLHSRTPPSSVSSTPCGFNSVGLRLPTRPQSHRTISEIAYAWGFADQSHFARRFREAFGMTPRDYRIQAASSVTGLNGHFCRFPERLKALIDAERIQAAHGSILHRRCSSKGPAVLLADVIGKLLGQVRAQGARFARGLDLGARDQWHRGCSLLDQPLRCEPDREPRPPGHERRLSLHARQRGTTGLRAGRPDCGVRAGRTCASRRRSAAQVVVPELHGCDMHQHSPKDARGAARTVSPYLTHFLPASDPIVRLVAAYISALPSTLPVDRGGPCRACQ